MKRISTSTKVVNKFGAGKHGFTDGNAESGIPATDLEADLFDHLQEELCAIVEAAGGAADGSLRNQVLTALRSVGVFQTAAPGDNSTKAATTAFIQALFTQFTGASSMTGNGYRVFPAYPGDPTPLILQWGFSGTGTGGVVGVTYPMAFPSAVHFIGAMMNASLGAGESVHCHVVGVPLLTGCTFSKTYANNGGLVGGASQPAFWLAIGK